MNPTQAILALVNKTTLASVLDQTSLINLLTISTDDTSGSGSSKLQGVTRPNYDSTLKAISSNALYAKSASSKVFPLLAAEQIARSIDVVEGRLDSTKEYDTTITFTSGNLPGLSVGLIQQVNFEQVIKVLTTVYLVDIALNNGTTIRLSTYDKDLINVPSSFYGSSTFNAVNNTYFASDDIVKMDGIKESSDIQVSEGNVGSGITLLSTTAGLLNAIQTENHINSKITLRVCFCKNGKLLIGPANAGLLKIDGANYTYDNSTKQALINLSTIKTWENINQISGVRTAESYLKAIDVNDGFFKNSKNAKLTKTFKEPS